MVADLACQWTGGNHTKVPRCVHAKFPSQRKVVGSSSVTDWGTETRILLSIIMITFNLCTLPCGLNHLILGFSNMMEIFANEQLDDNETRRSSRGRITD